jgi:tetratricopeptide (TPR) repeat protein
MISAHQAYAIGQILKKANDLEIKEKIEDAINEVKKAVDINPEDGNLYNRLGDLYLKLDQKDESIENFRKGVEAFRRDNFPRNALALGKKILRYDPDGFDMYYTIADLLAELDEKNEAAKYMFEYVEKQAKLEKKEEALNAIDYLKSLDIRDDKVQDRIIECCKMFDQKAEPEKHAKKPATQKPQIDEETAAALLKHAAARREKKVDKIDKFLNEFDGAGTLRQDIGQLDGAVKEVENAVVELRKSMRLDEVAKTLERSLNALSEEQKKALEILSASVGNNLDRLQKSVQEFYQHNDKNTKDMQSVFEKLSKALSSLSTNQASIAKELNANLMKMSGNFNVTTENSLKVVKSILENYKQATDAMIVRLDDTKNANTKLVTANEELVKANDSMKQELGVMSDTLEKFIADQQTKEKIRGRYLIAVVAVISLICGLVFFSVLFK